MKLKKHLQTENYTFYVDTVESDETAGVEMYDNNKNLVSNNFLAYNFLFEILLGESDEKIIFITKEMEYNRQQILKENC